MGKKSTMGKEKLNNKIAMFCAIAWICAASGAIVITFINPIIGFAIAIFSIPLGHMAVVLDEKTKEG